MRGGLLLSLPLFSCPGRLWHSRDQCSSVHCERDTGKWAGRQAEVEVTGEQGPDQLLCPGHGAECCFLTTRPVAPTHGPGPSWEAEVDTAESGPALSEPWQAQAVSRRPPLGGAAGGAWKSEALPAPPTPEASDGAGSSPVTEALPW